MRTEESVTSHGRKMAGRASIGARPTMPSPRRRAPRRVRVPELAVGLVIVSVCVLGALIWSRSLTQMSKVVVTTGTISRGETVDASDLAVAEIRGGESLGFAPAHRLDELVGRVSLVDLGADAPVVGAMLAEMPAMTADEALVGMALEVGHAPVDLAVGDTVRIVVVTDPNGLDPTPPRLMPGTALVHALEPGDDFEPRDVVTVGVPLDAAADVAAAPGVRLVRVRS